MNDNLQLFRKTDSAIQDEFRKKVSEGLIGPKTGPPISWSIWMFGRESLSDSLKRLQENGIAYVELAGNHHTGDLGSPVAETKRILNDYGMKLSGVCGLYSPEFDLAADSAVARQRAIDYIKREIEFVHELGGTYLIIVPSAVGRTQGLGPEELNRSADALRLVGDFFTSADVRAAVEPIRADEVSLVHSIKDAIEYIELVDHPGVAHINGDVYHMLLSETHIGRAIREADSRLINLHLADTNRGTLGSGMLDIDTALRAAYVTFCSAGEMWLTGEPIGSGRDPYAALTTTIDPKFADRLVADSIRYLNERIDAIFKFE